MAVFVLHFLLLFAISCRDTFWLLAHELTIFRSSLKTCSERAGAISSAFLGQTLKASNPIRQTLLTYLNLAGVERGYGYFAPNIPGSYKLVFELHYDDGRVETDLPQVGGSAAGLRIASLLDEVGRTPSGPLREYLVKMLAAAAWREHPDARMIRAVFGSITLPSITEFEHGKRESYEFLYAYDFTRPEQSANPPSP